MVKYFLTSKNVQDHSSSEEDRKQFGLCLREVRCYHLATELWNVTVHYISVMFMPLLRHYLYQQTNITYRKTANIPISKY